MKNTILLIVFISGITLSAMGLTINSVTLLPANPNNLDNVKVEIYTTLNYSPCTLVSSLNSIPNDTVYVYAYYQTGMLAALCNSRDTIDIGQIPCHVRGMSVTVFESGGTSGSATHILPLNITCTGVGVESYESTYSFSLYPNPASKQLSIKLNGRLSAPLRVTILNMLGEKIMPAMEIDPAKLSENTIDIASLAKGLYLVKTESKNGSFVKRFVKE